MDSVEPKLEVLLGSWGLPSYYYKEADSHLLVKGCLLCGLGIPRDFTPSSTTLERP